MTADSTIHWIATCATGLEAALAQELTRLGATTVECRTGAVEAEGTMALGYRACLWSRLAERVLLPLATFPARSPDDVYDACRRLRWNDHMRVDSSFSVNAVVSPEVGHQSNFVALRVKDAVVDAVRNAQGERPSVDARTPDLPLYLYWPSAEATLFLDFAGVPLHRRGYRTEAGEAPLRETLAAGMLALSGWPEAGVERIFDPFCGSGTLLIEALWMALDIAPGLERSYFGFLGWRQHDQMLWNQLRQDADARRRQGLDTSRVRAIGYDADRETLRIARDNVERAGLTAHVHLERRELGRVDDRHLTSEVTGWVVTNPPFGERLSERIHVPLLYAALGRVLGRFCAGWRVGVLAAAIEDADRVLIDTPVVHRLYNGPLRVYWRCGVLRALPSRTVRLPAIQSGEHEVPDLANRIAKNLRGLKRFLEKGDVECVRLYDADIPEYNMAIDWYNGDIHLQEYAPPKTVDPAKAAHRLEAAIRTLNQALGTHPSRIHVKSRQRQRGTTQYQRLGEKAQWLDVMEGPARLQVNLDDYLDTGLFLDHRPTRLQIGRIAEGTRFLNLFCYTAAATVHAGLGGARRSVSVDSSRTYLAWAARNIANNGLSDDLHRLVQADVRRWLNDTREQFDLIFMDPPTFSNAKAREDLDIQRDHVDLIFAAMRRLERDGLLIFSNNFRKFTLDEAALSGFDVRDVTRASLPPDFAGNPPIHRCWEIRYPTG